MPFIKAFCADINLCKKNLIYCFLEEFDIEKKINEKLLKKFCKYK